MLFLNSEEQSHFSSEGKDNNIGYFYNFGPFSTEEETKEFIIMLLGNHGREILGTKIYQHKKNHLMPEAPKGLYVKVYVK